MKLALVFLFSFITLVRSIDLCECSSGDPTCPGSCREYTLDICTQELDICTGSPITGSYIIVEGNLTGLYDTTYRITWYTDNTCTDKRDVATWLCNYCREFGDPPNYGFAGEIQCPGGGSGEKECSANVVVYDDDNCGKDGYCDDRDNLRNGECNTLFVDDRTFYAYVNCSANSTTIYSGDDCTGTGRISDDTNCVSIGDYSVQVFFSDECPSDGDGDGSSHLETNPIADIASNLFYWALST